MGDEDSLVRSRSRWRTDNPICNVWLLEGKRLKEYVWLSIEMVGDAEHEEVGPIVCGDVAFGEVELSEIVFVFDEGGDFWSEIIFHAGQNIKTGGK
jgi:hypothetical protein